jgi:predicted hotdog family 3-hydroxylacyl-ACP dehydratase
MLAGKSDIAQRIPHEGAMCLLDGVLEWNAETIRCRATSHLYAISGVEYASQAMAMHGALSGSVTGRPRAGYLASLRDVVCHRAWLDESAAELIVTAQRVMGDESRVVYGFSVVAGGTEIVAGRATVVLDIS